MCVCVCVCVRARVFVCLYVCSYHHSGQTCGWISQKLGIRIGLDPTYNIGEIFKKLLP